MDCTKTIRELMDTHKMAVSAARYIDTNLLTSSVLALAEVMDKLAANLIHMETRSDLEHEDATPVYRMEADIWEFANLVMLRLQAQCQLMRNNALDKLDKPVQEEAAEGKDEKDEG